MGFLKFSENIFLELAEYKRLQKFLNEDGIKRHTLINTDSYGLVRQSVLPEIGSIELADSFYVSKAGTPFDDIIVDAGIAIDSNANLIINSKPINMKVPNDGLWYWVKIKHEYSVKELGKVSIDALGNLTGVGTKFKEILRGQPNYPTKIKFLNSTNGNSQSYEVVKVLNDTNAILSGDFTMEVDMEYGVFGTFTPGYPVPAEDQMIYMYDSSDISFIPESTLGQAPNHLLNEEFYIARVRNNGIDVTLQDKRINWWETEAMKYLRFIDRELPNPVIGVEAVKNDISTSTKAKNLIELAWGFRTNSYTIDTSSKKISILIGNGGIYKDTSFFQSGDFNGWRLYSKNGSWRTIIDSQKTGTQIVITLDVLNPSDYDFAHAKSDVQLFIAPPYEEIEFRFRRDGKILDTNDIDGDNVTTEVFPWPSLEKIFSFNINTPLAKVKIPALNDCYKYNLTFRYKVYNEYTDWLKLPDDTIGYFDESSFDEFGNLNSNQIDRVKVPYVGHLSYGFVKVCEDENSFNNWQQYIDTGELYGVNTTQFANSTPTINLEVGENKRYQHYKGAELTLSADMYIHLKRLRTDGSHFREGNTFYIHIEQWLNLSNFKLRIVEDFIDPTNFTELALLDDNDMMFVRNNTSGDNSQSIKKGLFITCTYNEHNHWIISYVSETVPEGVLRMVKNATSDDFNASGYGQRQGFWGWKIVNEMNNIFPTGTDNLSEVGDITGSNEAEIGSSNLPKHKHTFSGQTNRDGGHEHSQKAGNGDSGGGFDKGEYDSNRFYATSSNNEVSKHVHHFSGETDFSGGQTSPSGLDIRPKRMKLLFIEKIV